MEAGQKDKLTYVSLVHQIMQAKPMGYTDQKITVTPSTLWTVFRNYIKSILRETWTVSTTKCTRFM